jgi:Mn-dependent DtxR family transcriptional regulator
MKDVATSMTNKEREEKWKAEDDARTLAEAEVIKGDGKRHAKAKEAGERLAKEAHERAEAMERIAKSKMKYDKSEMPPAKE